MNEQQIKDLFKIATKKIKKSGATSNFYDNFLEPSLINHPNPKVYLSIIQKEINAIVDEFSAQESIDSLSLEDIISKIENEFPHIKRYMIALKEKLK